MIGDIIAIGAIVLIVGGALAYIIKAKKSGKKCIGCPDSASCGSRSVKNGSAPSCGGCCSCCSGCAHSETEE